MYSQGGYGNNMPGQGYGAQTQLPKFADYSGYGQVPQEVSQTQPAAATYNTNLMAQLAGYHYMATAMPSAMAGGYGAQTFVAPSAPAPTLNVDAMAKLPRDTLINEILAPILKSYPQLAAEIKALVDGAVAPVAAAQPVVQAAAPAPAPISAIRQAEAPAPAAASTAAASAPASPAPVAAARAPTGYAAAAAKPAVPAQAPTTAKSGGAGAGNPPAVMMFKGSTVPARNVAIRPPGVPASALPGYIFQCSKESFQECIDRMLLGSGKGSWRDVQRIAPGYTQLFLYDITDKQLYGIFEASEEPSLDIERDAWSTAWPRPAGVPGTATKFPAQTRVKLAHFMEHALFRDSFIHLVRQLDRGRFEPALTDVETMNLIREFWKLNK